MSAIVDDYLNQQVEIFVKKVRTSYGVHINLTGAASVGGEENMPILKSLKYAFRKFSKWRRGTARLVLRNYNRDVGGLCLPPGAPMIHRGELR